MVAWWLSTRGFVAWWAEGDWQQAELRKPLNLISVARFPAECRPGSLIGRETTGLRSRCTQKNADAVERELVSLSELVHNGRTFPLNQYARKFKNHRLTIIYNLEDIETSDVRLRQTEMFNHLVFGLLADRQNVG